MAQERLLASVRIGYAKLQSDVTNINSILKKINNGKKNISLNVQMKGLEQSKFTTLSNRLTLLNQQFSRLNQLILNINKNSSGLGNLGNILNRATNATTRATTRGTGSQTDLGTLAAIQGTIQKQVENINKSGTTVSTAYQNQQGLTTRVLSDEAGKIISQSRERINANAQLERSINRIITAYNKLSEAGRKDLNNVRNTINSLTSLSSKYDESSTQYAKIMRAKEKMLNIERQLTAAANRQPLQNQIDKYRMLSIEQQKMPTNIKRVIAEIDKLIARERQEGREISRLIQLRNQYQRTLSSSVSRSRAEMDALGETIRRRGLGEFLGGTNVVGSGDRRAGILNKISNSFIYATSAMAMSQVYAAVGNLVDVNKEFELGLISLARTMDNVTTGSIQRLGDAAINTAKRYGIALKDVQDAQSELARAGISNEADLKTLTETVALGLNTTEIKNAEEMVGFLISTIKQLNLDVSDSNKIIDEWNYLADKFAVHSNDFAEALTKAGASSRMLGLELEDVNSMVVVLGERTQASGSEIGNAIKTLESNLLRPETVKTLESYGIAVKKNADEFLDFKTIMTNVNEVLQQFDEGAVASDEILRSMGGTWRRNWIALLSDSWDEIEGINRKQTEAIGYSASENEKVMQTYAKQVEVLKASFSELGVEIGKAGLFDALKGVASVLNTFSSGFQRLTPELRRTLILIGEIFLVIKIGSLGIAKAFNVSLIQSIMKTSVGLRALKNVTIETATAKQYLIKAMEAEKITSVQYNAILTGLTNKQKVRNLSVEQARIQENAYALAMRETAAASKAVARATNIAMIGATLLITGLVTVWQTWRQSQEDARKSLDDSINTHKENNKVLTEAIEYYKENSSLINTDDEVKQKLIETQTQLNQLYGDEADGYDLVNGKIDENINKMEEKSRKERELLIKDMEVKVKANKQLKFSAEKASLSDISIPGILNKETDFTYFKDKEFSDLNYQEYYNRLKEQQDAIRSGNDELIAQAFKIRDANQITDSIRGQLLGDIQKKIADIEPYIKQENVLLAEQQSLISDSVIGVRNLNEEELNLYNTLKVAFDKTPVEDYYDEIWNLIDAIKEFDDNIESGKNVDTSMFTRILPSGNNFDIESVISKSYPKLFESLTGLISNYEEVLKDATSAVNQLKSAQDELNDTGKLTEDNLIMILEQDSNLINSLGNRKKLQEAINNAVKKEADIAQNAYASKLMYSNAFYTNLLKNNQSLYNMLSKYYGSDFKNFKSLAEAKNKVESAVIKVIGANWSRYYKTQTAALDAQIRAVRSLIVGGESAALYGKQLSELYNLRNMLQEVQKISNNISTVNFVGPSFDLNSGSGSGSSSDSTRDALIKDRYTDINALIDRQNMLLERNKNLQQYQAEINGDLEYRIQLLKQELSLAQQQMKNQSKLQDMLRSERTSLESKLKSEGISFSGSGDDKYITNAKSRIDKLTDLVNKYRNSTSSSGKKAYEKYKKELDELEANVSRFNQIQFNEIPNAINEWRDLDLEIRKIKESVSELQIEKVLQGFIKATKRYEDALKGIDYEIQRLGGETALAKTSDLVMEKVRLTTDEVNNQRYALNQLLAVTDATVLSSEAYKNQLSETQDSLRQNILILQDLTNAQKENAKSSIAGLESRINSILDKGIELRKEALNEELDLYKEHVDNIIKQRERQYEAEDFEKNLQDEYENRQELVNKINRLNLDSSLESYNKRKELEKQLQEFDEKIADLKEQRQRDLIKQNLEDNVAAKENETSEAIALIDEEFDIIKRRALIHETIMSESFTNLQTMLPELFQTLGDGVNSFFDTFESYEEHFGETLGNVSQKFSDEILPQLQNAFSAIDTYEERAAKLQIQALQLKYDNTSDKDLKSQYKQQASDIMNQYGFEYEDLRFADLNSGFYTTGETPTQQNANQTLDVASITADPIFQEEKAKLKIRDYQIAYATANETQQKELAQKANAIRDIWGWSYEDLKQWIPSKYDEQTLRSYSGGLNKGLVTQTGKYLLHGNSSNPEWVLTNTQMFNLVRNLATAVPSITNNSYSDKNDIVVNIPIYGNVDNGVVKQLEVAGTKVVHEIRKSLNKKGIYK